MPQGLTNAEVAELYETYGHLVLRRCRAVTRSEALAEDAMQNAFIKAMRYGGSLREAESRLGWLYRTADRCCFDLLTKRRRRAEVSDERTEQRGSPHPEARIEARDAAMALLGRMNERDRQIAVRFFLDGLSQGEIAEEVGVSRVTVNKRVQWIRAKAEKLAKAR